MSSLIVFTGENTYALFTELKRWKHEFIQKHGADNLLAYSGKEAIFSRLVEEAAVLPFLSEKRLLIVDGIPTMEVEQLDVLNASIHPSALVVFISSTIDKRLKINKSLLAMADVHTFDALKEYELKQWVQQTAQELGLTLNDQLVMYLIETVGTDQYALYTELSKLATYDGTVTKELIQDLCIVHSDKLIWSLWITSLKVIKLLLYSCFVTYL